jgi:hypothetical protein
VDWLGYTLFSAFINTLVIHWKHLIPPDYSITLYLRDVVSGKPEVAARFEQEKTVE